MQMSKEECIAFMNTAFGTDHMRTFLHKAPLYRIDQAETIMHVSYMLYLDAIFSHERIRPIFLDGRKNLNMFILAYMQYVRSNA